MSRFVIAALVGLAALAAGGGAALASESADTSAAADTSTSDEGSGAGSTGPSGGSSPPDLTLMGLPVYAADNGYCWTAGMELDADGSATAYNASNTGIDYIGNAHHDPHDLTSRWVGVVTDKAGNPVVAPNGYYVSPTALVDGRYGLQDQRRYVDASSVGYVAIGGAALAAMGAAMGDLAVVVRFKTGAAVGCVLGDEGSATGDHIHEVSVFAGQSLGLGDGTAKHGGANSGVGYVVFPGTSTGWPRDSYAEDALAAFEAWGGVDRLRQIVGV